ncbi:flagellar hook-associated protein FlgL [Botrimarina colliarenosi]|uniref:Flagellar hook-associated protein FlgL n=2 Tax=Botrimarina colliarenosi TaxID=2528001 RepID=A0A5C6AH49_9BACT|nr:flagellar hook-associated protein FlgL [Botrimarina colliarenosi]
MMRGRLTAQIQNDQLDLAKLQNQLSSGYRIFLPSDDPAAAQRAMALQRTIERKDQSLTNLAGAKIALSSTDVALSDVNNSLNDLKGAALGVMDTIATDTERQAVIDQIDELIASLTRVGNSTLSTNYLLGGSEQSSIAYRKVDGYIEYLGDEASPQTFVDISQLFETNVSGDDVFGGLSEAVRGSSDLNASLTPETQLSQLNGGLGIRASGAVEIRFTPASPTQPVTTALIDLSKAKSIDDVARLIEAGAPNGADLTVSLDGAALRIDAADGGITIREVGNGKTAYELGILNPSTPAATVSGTDLDPILRPTTRLDDLVGSKTRGRIVSGGPDNDLVLTATSNGASFNGLTVNYVDDGSAGLETADYDQGLNTLTVHIASGVSNATDIAAAITAEGTFVAEPDYRDQTSTSKVGSGKVIAGTDLGVDLTGGVDGQLDIASGLIVTNGDETYTIDTSGAETIEDLLGLLNNPQYGLAATINASGDGVDVRTRRSGAAFSIGENGGTTATQLGLRTYTETSRLADFNRDVGVIEFGANDNETRSQNRFDINVTEDGVTQTYSIDPVGLLTVQDLIDRIAADTGGAVSASLAETGNGLVLNVTDPDAPASFASGSFSLGADTISIDATTAGVSGNYPFTVEVIDSGGTGPLQTTVSGNSIVVDLQGVAAGTDAIAASIAGQLSGFTVTSSGTDSIAAAVGPVAAATTGGAPASDLAAPAVGQFTLLGDTIRLEATEVGGAGNQALSVEVIDSGGTGPLLTSYDPDTGVVSVDLQGVDTTTDAIAQSIQDTLTGFTVTSNGTAAVATTDVVGLPPSFDATTSGGQAADSITLSGDVAERLGFLPDGEDSVTVVGGSVASTDRNTLEVDSVFTTLIRMREALQAADPVALGSEINRLDEDLDRVTFGRSEVGVRLKNLDSIEQRLVDESISLQDALSTEIDADFVKVISDFTAKQYALQASLQTAGALVNLTILDYI